MGLRKLKEYRKAPQMHVLKYEPEEKTKFPTWMLFVLMTLLSGIFLFSAEKEKQTKPEENIEEFVKKALENKTDKKRFIIAKIPAELAEQIGSYTQKSVKNFTYSITADAVRHIEKQHGKNKEKQKGQRSVLSSDYVDLKTVLLTPDMITKERPARNGAQTLRFIKIMNNSQYTIVTEVSNKKSTLGVATYYIKISKP